MTFKLYREVRSLIINVLNASSTINFDGTIVKCYSRRLDMNSQVYAELNVGMGYQLTLLDDLPTGVSLNQVIKQQSRGIYPIIKTVDYPSNRPFCINEYLTLVDGSIALNGYVCYNKANTTPTY